MFRHRNLIDKIFDFSAILKKLLSVLEKIKFHLKYKIKIVLESHKTRHVPINHTQVNERTKLIENVNKLN